MLVKLKRDWFDPNGAFHVKDRPFSYNGPLEDLPSTALVEVNGVYVSAHKDKIKPKTSPVEQFLNEDNSPKPGFGAKPVEEQIQDIVGAGPTHQITTTAGAADADAGDKAEAKRTDNLAKVAEKAAENVKTSIDPFETVKEETKSKK